MDFLTDVKQNFASFPWDDYAYNPKYRDVAWSNCAVYIIRGDSNHMELKKKFDNHFWSKGDAPIYGIYFEKMVKLLKIAKLESDKTESGKIA